MISSLRFAKQIRIRSASLLKQICPCISIIFLSSIERGTKYPKADTLARISQVLDVEVFELFKGELIPSDSKKLVTHLSKDITKKLTSALDDIFKQYLG